MVTVYKIHPAIGIARVGNSPDEFFVGPERIGEHRNPLGGFKDGQCRVKHQAARLALLVCLSSAALVSQGCRLYTWEDYAPIAKATTDLNDAEEAIARDPNDARAWLRKGEVLGRMGRPEESLESLDRAIELDPKLALAWSYKGSVLLDLSRPPEALRCFDRSIALDPKSCRPWVGKGAALAYMERPQEALRCLERATQLQPDDVEAWYSKGLILASLQRFQEAKSALSESARLGYPPSEEALKRLREEGH